MIVFSGRPRGPTRHVASCDILYMVNGARKFVNKKMQGYLRRKPLPVKQSNNKRGEPRRACPRQEPALDLIAGGGPEGRGEQLKKPLPQCDLSPVGYPLPLFSLACSARVSRSAPQIHAFDEALTNEFRAFMWAGRMC
jgi:hypothetical protein